MASVHVRMFATVREAAGVSEVDATVSTLSELMQHLRDRFGARMAEAIGARGSEPERVVVLINGRGTGGKPAGEVMLNDGDEVAVFPPVSGG